MELNLRIRVNQLLGLLLRDEATPQLLALLLSGSHHNLILDTCIIV